MSRMTIVNRSQLFAAATTISAVGFLILPASAQAFPILPPCSQWGFPGYFSLYQSTGDSVSFTATGPTVHGFIPVSAESIDRTMYAHGGIDGSITGDHVDFSILWELGPPGGSNGRYLGNVGTDGYAHGSTYDTYDPDPRHVAHWDSQVPLVCITPTAQPPAGLPADTVVTPFPDRRAVPPFTPGQ
jgi:hypothetical protein